MNKKTLTRIAISFMMASPLLAYAANISDILGQIENVLSRVIPILMVLATVVFLWGVIRYITAAGDEDKLKEGRQFIIFGLVGLFVMVAVWGVVRALVSQFQLQNTNIPGGPRPESGGGSFF